MMYFLRNSILSAVLLLAVFVMNSAVLMAQSIPPSYTYGVTSNTIKEIDLLNKSSKTVLTDNRVLNSNAFAFDKSRNLFFFINSSGLQVWDRGSNITQIASRAALGIGESTIANAAFYDNAYWFVFEGTSYLIKNIINFSGATPTLASQKFYNLNNTPSFNSFGDIAITSTGTLYACTAPKSFPPTGGVFYSVNLNTLVETDPPPSNQNLANTIRTDIRDPETSAVMGLQLGFSSDESALFGHDVSTGKWFTINLANGNLTRANNSDASAFITDKFQDLTDMSPETPVNRVDLQVSISNNQTSYTPGSAVTYTVVVTSDNVTPVDGIGPIDVANATVTITPPSGITIDTWSLSYSGGGSANGTGNISGYALNSLPVGGTATFTINGTISSGATGSLQTTASVNITSSYNDINTSNNSVTDTDNLLPVVWGSFTARADRQDVQLEWSTLQESNTRDFIIERSIGGQPWTKLGSVPAAGYAQTTRRYTFTDALAPNGQLSYRILQRDLDEKFEYSDVRGVDMRSGQRIITLMGNPVLNGQLQFMIREKGILSIVGINGQEMLRQSLETGLTRIDAAAWQKGVYYYQFSGNYAAKGTIIIP